MRRRAGTAILHPSMHDIGSSAAGGYRAALICSN
jgi:hypothetical protein